MVRRAVAERPNDISKFVWVPFNEPDGMWYRDWGTQKQQFFDD